MTRLTTTMTGSTPKQKWERRIICFCLAARSRDREKPSSGNHGHFIMAMIDVRRMKAMFQWRRQFLVAGRWGEYWRGPSRPPLVDQVGDHIILHFLSAALGSQQSTYMITWVAGQEIIYAWARNAPKLELPPAVGFKVGGPGSDVKYLVLQVH